MSSNSLPISKLSIWTHITTHLNDPALFKAMYAEGLLLRATHFPLVPGGGVPSFELDEQD